MITQDLSLCVWESSQRGRSAVNLAATPKRCQVKLVNLSDLNGKIWFFLREKTL